MNLIILVTILIVIGLIALFFSFPIVEVIGDSMHPTYKDGEYILSRRLFKKIKVGDVVICKSPTGDLDHTIIIKRVAYIDYSREIMYLLGDNSNASFDSRYYGYVPTNLVISKVVRPRNKEEL